MVTAEYEGAYYSLKRDYSRPIRIFSDRTIEDDILSRKRPDLKRKRLPRNEFRRVRRAALDNTRRGLA